MSTSTPKPELDHEARIFTPEAVYRSPWQRWKDFWFKAADPTTLAFIRICTGLLVLYIHLAYSLDLQAFFGKHGWYAAAFIEKERQESPSYVSSFWDWDANYAFPRLSDFPHRRQALMTFLRGLPTDKTERAAALRYLNRANEFAYPDDFRIALYYLQSMGTRPEELNNYLTVLLGGELESPERTAAYTRDTPPMFRSLPVETRSQIADEIRAMWTTLGRMSWTDPDRDRTYVFNHLVEVAPEQRKSLIDYINTLPEDAVERAKLLDYLEYWNNDPRKAYRLGSGIFSVWFHVTDPTQMAIIHIGVLIVIFLFTIGLFTRVTSVLVWLACVGYIHRTQQVLFGMDTMMNILLFYLMIGNSGAALSVDRLIARYRAVRASLKRTGTLDPQTSAFLAYPPPSVGAGFAVRLLQIHFCFIYAAAGLSKLKGQSWWGGQAFWEVVVNPEFTLMQYGWYEKSLRWFASVKPIYYAMTIIAVWFTLFIEISFAFLIWTRMRWLLILLATAMHALIAVLMGLNLFELLMIVMLLAFLPDRVIRDRLRGAANLVRYRFRFNPQNAAQVRAAACTASMDVDNQVELVPDRTATVPELVGADNQAATGSNGVSTMFRNVRLLGWFRWVLWIPGIRALWGHRLFPQGDATPRESPKTSSLTPRSPTKRS